MFEPGEESIQQLVEMGFEHDKAKTALVGSQGNFDVALEHLFSY